MGDLGGNNLDLVGQILAEGKAGPTNRAEHVSTVGQFLDAHLLAKTNVTKLAARWSLDLADLEFTTNCRLTEGQGGIAFKICCEICHLLWRGKLIETVSQ